MINGTRLAWKGTKAFARANTRMTLVAYAHTSEAGNSVDETIDKWLSPVYWLGFAFGAVPTLVRWFRLKRGIKRMQARVAAELAAGQVWRAACWVLAFEVRWNREVDLSAMPELEAMAERVAQDAINRGLPAGF